MAYVKPHMRKLKSGKVVAVRGYTRPYVVRLIAKGVKGPPGYMWDYRTEKGRKVKRTVVFKNIKSARRAGKKWQKETKGTYSIEKAPFKIKK